MPALKNADPADRDQLWQSSCPVCVMRRNPPVECSKCETAARGHLALSFFLSFVVANGDSQWVFFFLLTPGVWVCIVCGFVGCGRTQFGKELEEMPAAHAIDHFQKTEERHALVGTAL